MYIYFDDQFQQMLQDNVIAQLSLNRLILCQLHSLQEGPIDG